MSHLCCPGCRVRFSAVAATYLRACPECGVPPTVADGSQAVMGFRLMEPLDASHSYPEAIAVSLPVAPRDGIRGPDLNL